MYAYGNALVEYLLHFTISPSYNINHSQTNLHKYYTLSKTHGDTFTFPYTHDGRLYNKFTF